MLKKIGAVVGAAGVGMLLAGGAASADDDQAGLANLNDLDALHEVNGTLGVCDNNINVLIVQVPVRDVANGIDVPVLSPGEHEAAGETPDNCAGGGVLSSGSVQGD